MTALLAVQGLSAGYHRHPVVEGLDLEVSRGEVVALLGPNGAGKTTTILALAGELAPLAGTVSVDGEATRAALHKRARGGLSLVTEQRAVFMGLSVRENLRVARCDHESLALFPELEPLLDRRAGLLSGGEQQMLALTLALGRQPRLLLIDELSLGLAPLIVERLLKAVRQAADSGIGVLLVEQSLGRALSVADRVYLMRRGKIVLNGRADEVADDIHALEASYLEAGETTTANRGA